MTALVRRLGTGTAMVRRLAVAVLLTVIVGSAAAGVVAVASGDWQVRPILSGSMRPGFPVGGIVATQRVPVSTLRVGDVVVFHPPHQAGVTYIHRIVWLERKGDRLLVRTKGDANVYRDPWTLRVRGPVAYQARFTLPLLGYAAVWLHSPGGRRDMLIVAGCAFLVCAVSLLAEWKRRFRRTTRREPAGLSADRPGPPKQPEQVVQPR